jgi:hypothetical protein
MEIFKMETGGKKIVKTQKTKYRKKTENIENFKFVKSKHHDKTFYRLAKEDKDYAL